MENLKIEDLVEGEIYYTINPSGNKYIFKSRESKTSKYSNRLISDGNFNNNDYFGTGGTIERNLRKATFEEKHWLNSCIEKNEFVPYEKAIKTFNQNLVGRWVKKIKSDMWDSLLKKDEYDEIIEENNIEYVLKKAKAYYKDVFPRFSDHFELMPIGWTPNQQNTQQYEVGRWYKLPNNMNNNNNVIIYIKFKNITDSGHQEYSHRIIKNKGYEENYGRVKTNIELLTDLSEIQQYLPESHPDKLVKQEPKQSYAYEVVHCQTKEEWNFVREKTTKVNSQEWEKAIGQYSEGIALVSNGSSWCGLNYFKQFNTLILSFNEWCNKFGHSPDFMNKKQEIPEYLEVLQGFFCEKDQIGKIYKTTEVFPIHLEHCQKLNWEEAYLKNQSCFKPSTKEAYEAQFLLSKGTQYEKVSDNYTINYITGVDPYQNETIEIGDFVNWTNSGTFDKKDFPGYEVWKINKNNFYIIYESKKEEYQNYPLNIQGLKIIKKAKNNTTHVNKKVDDSLPENKNLITTKEKSLAHLLGIKKQLPNKTKRTQLTIIKPKQLKLN